MSYVLYLISADSMTSTCLYFQLNISHYSYKIPQNKNYQNICECRRYFLSDNDATLPPLVGTFDNFGRIMDIQM